VAAEFAVRPMLPTDADRLREIAVLSFSRFMGFFAVHSLLSEDGQVLVSEAKGTVVGFAKLIEFNVGIDKFGCILWLAVHPQFRRKGVASALVNAGTTRLKDDGARAVFASLQRRNVASLAVFSRQCFRKMGFLGLWRLFSCRMFKFYSDIWFAPGEIVLMHD
jgi:ribosomal protein S18 acetylase RimI-like enzyme